MRYVFLTGTNRGLGQLQPKLLKTVNYQHYKSSVEESRISIRLSLLTSAMPMQWKNLFQKFSIL